MSSDSTNGGKLSNNLNLCLTMNESRVVYLAHSCNILLMYLMKHLEVHKIVLLTSDNNDGMISKRLTN